MYKTKLYIFLFLLVAASAFCQDRQLIASLDSVKIHIGSQANLTLKTIVNEGTKVEFPKDHEFGQLEVLESYPVDTIEKDEKYQLVKKYGLTQFDSGRYVIPPLTVIIGNKDYKTDEFYLEVADVQVDTTKQKMYDIKPVATQESETNFWWYIIIILSFILIGLGIYWDIKRRRHNQKPEIYIAPIEKATGSLKRLDHQQLLHKGEVKEYYSTLSRIVRTYIEETMEFPAMESTTPGVLEGLTNAAPRKRMTIDEKVFHDLERVLSNSDMVKFALFKPDEKQVITDRALTEELVYSIESAIPEPTQEEIELTEAYRLRQLQKKQRRKRTLLITACSVLVVGTLAFFGFQRLYGYLQENVIGYSAQELWEGDWVKSEYGNPAIVINTPKVLKRTNIAQFMPKETLAKLQEIQVFHYGAPFSELYVTVGTMKFMPGIQTDTNVAIDMAIRDFEANGGKNITVNTERYTFDNTYEGTRAYGTLSFGGVKGQERYYYEILYFQQQQGLQQVMLLRKDQDEYAIKIAEKIKKSIRYKEVI